MLIPALCTLLWHYGLTQLFSASPHCMAAPSELESRLTTVLHGLASTHSSSLQRAGAEQGCLCIIEPQSGFMPYFQERYRKKAIWCGKLCCGVIATGIFCHFLGKSYDRGSRRLVTVQETQMHSQPWPSLPLCPKTGGVMLWGESQCCFPLFLWKMQVVLPMAVTWSASSLECASKNNIPLVLSSLFSPFPFFLIPSPQTGHLSLSSHTKFPIKLSTRGGEKGAANILHTSLQCLAQCLAQINCVIFSKAFPPGGWSGQ